MKRFAALLALLLASFALVACGGGSDTTDEGTSPAAGAAEEAEEKAEEVEKEAEGDGTSALEFEADPGGSLAYTTDSATAKAGEVEVMFTNESSVPHDVAIEDSSGETIAQTEILAEGSDSTTANLKPGEYKFYCSVSGHRTAGMEGTLTVK